MDSRIPSSLTGNLQLQRAYLRELRQVQLRSCGGDCGKAELDRKYTKLARPQASLDKRNRRR